MRRFLGMRRKDRQVSDAAMQREIILACSCCRLGFCDEGGAYIVPLNFGYEERGGKRTFYFHKGRGTGRLRAGYGLAAERGEGGLRVFRELPERDRQGRGEPDRGPGGEAVRSGADNGAQLWPGRLGVPGGDAGQRGGFQAGGDGA